VLHETYKCVHINVCVMKNTGFWDETPCLLLVYAYSAGRFRLPFRESAPFGAMECPLFNSAGAYSGRRLRRVGAGSRVRRTSARSDHIVFYVFDF